MRRMPLAGLIGACSLGMLLTGCTCSSKNGGSLYAGGKPDRGMGLLSGGGRSRTPKADIDGMAKGSLPLPASEASATSFVSSGSSSSGSAGASSTSMGMPNSSSSLTSMSGGSALPLNSSSAMPLSTSTTSMNSSSRPMSNVNTAAIAAPPDSTPLASSPIRQVSYGTGDSSSVKNAAYSSTEIDTTPDLPMKGSGRVIPPPPPPSDSYTPPPSSKAGLSAVKSSTSSSISPWPPTSSTPPPAPPPSISSGSMSNSSSSDASTTSNSSSLSMPSYMMKPKGSDQ